MSATELSEVDGRDSQLLVGNPTDSRKPLMPPQSGCIRSVNKTATATVGSMKGVKMINRTADRKWGKLVTISASTNPRPSCPAYVFAARLNVVRIELMNR